MITNRFVKGTTPTFTLTATVFVSVALAEWTTLQADTLGVIAELL